MSTTRKLVVVGKISKDSVRDPARFFVSYDTCRTDSGIFFIPEHKAFRTALLGNSVVRRRRGLLRAGQRFSRRCCDVRIR